MAENGQFAGGSAYPDSPMLDYMLEMQQMQMGIPHPNPQQGITGNGGYVSQGGQLVSGLSAGLNMANQVTANRRMGQLWKRNGPSAPGSPEQNAENNAVNVAAGIPPQGQDAHAGLLADMAHALGHVGTAVGNFFYRPAGGAPAAGTQPNASQLQPIQTTAQDMPTSGMQRGGVVPEPDHTIRGAQRAIPGQSAFADGGPVPAGPVPAAPAAAAPAQGAPPTAAPDGSASIPPLQQTDPNQALQGSVEQLAGLLHGAALNDKGVPNGQQGLPAPGQSPQASAAAATQAAGGDPESPPANGQPHSLTPAYWEQTDSAIHQAMLAAEKAGKDPMQVYNSLNGLRTSFFQSHILRNLSSASAALEAGDQKGLEQALRNTYYYFPDGADLQLHHGDKGELQYQDPWNPVGQDGKPNFVDVTPEHIQELGMAALNPTGVADMLMNYKVLAYNAQTKRLQAEGTAATGRGRELMGEGAAARAQADLQRVPSQNYQALSAGDLDRARAASSSFALALIRNNKLDPTAAKGASDAASMVDQAILGPPTQVPTQDASGNPSLSPAAGRVIHDSSRVDPSLRGMSAMDVFTVKGWASGLFAGNPQGMTPALAASTALHAYSGLNQTHSVKDDPSPFAKGQKGNTVPNTLIDRQHSTLHMWNPKTKSWSTYPMAQGAALPSGQYGQTLMQLLQVSAGGGVSSPVPQPPAQDSQPPSWMMDDTPEDADSSSP